jgi:hypothetical protein
LFMLSRIVLRTPAQRMTGDHRRQRIALQRGKQASEGWRRHAPVPLTGEACGRGRAPAQRAG